MKKVVIVSAARTPFGKFGGALKNMKAVELGGVAIKAALERAGIEGKDVDEVIMGMVVAAGAGQVPGRQASLKAGIPHSVPALTINKVCGSGMKAINLAAQIIKAGDADILVAGGMESMSNIPYITHDARWGARMGDVKLVDAMIKDGLWCPENDVHMAIIGGQLASEFDVTREDQDRWAYRSQMRWAKAQEEGKFDDELTPVTVKSRKGDVVVSVDEGPRPNTTLEALSKLPPVFCKDGTITAGNAPGVNDGAAAVVVMSEEKAKEFGCPILAHIKGYAQVSLESKYIATVPGKSIAKLLNKNDLTLGNMDLIEINEAFAAVPLVSCKILEIDKDVMDEKVNVNGSAVAVGHPIGATGARILMTLIFELKRRSKKNGVCALCGGMAQGDAIWLQVD